MTSILAARSDIHWALDPELRVPVFERGDSGELGRQVELQDAFPLRHIAERHPEVHEFVAEVLAAMPCDE